MTFKRILCRSFVVLLCALTITAVGGYCWLYSWTWGSAPEPHHSLSSQQAAKLAEFDKYIVETVPSLHHDIVKRQMEITVPVFDGDLVNMSKPEKSWKDSLILKLSSSVASRVLLAPAREALHSLLETGAAEPDECYLAVLAMKKLDTPLFRLLVEKGVNPQASFMDKEGYILQELIAGSDGLNSFLPVRERIELLEWLVERGADITAVPEETVLLMAELSLRVTDDADGAMLDWFLRHEYKIDPARAAFCFLCDDALQKYQQLVRDRLLPVPPAEFSTPDLCCTPLQLVAGAGEPSPETLRWLLSLGHQPNALPPGADSPAPESEDDERPRILRLTPLDACLDSIRYFSLGQSVEDDARLRGKLEMLDILLQHGARPTAETRELRPLDRALDSTVMDLFRKHSFRLDSGDDPYNACCSPE